MIAYTVVLTTNSYEVLIAAMVALGIVSTIRVQIAIVYLSEHLKKADWNRAFFATALF